MPGPNNAITDVPGVRVGQVTRMVGDSIRTGVTAIVPHGGNTFFSRVPAAIVVGNGFGKLLGVTQVQELGELETPILLTCTLCVWRAADAMVDYLLHQPGMEQVRSINPVVGETNDGSLNDIRNRPIRPEDVVKALTSADTGKVEEGSVGAGTGTIAFGWKGGIGTSSRRTGRPQAAPTGGSAARPGEAADRDDGYTVGVLVQSNFGGAFTVMGVPMWKELRRTPPPAGRRNAADGSIMIVVATDAPVSDRNLRRMASRALMGLGRTGGYGSNGSGDYVIAFSTAESVRRTGEGPVRQVSDLDNDAMSSLFEAVAEATEEAIYNSLFMATTVESRGGRAEAVPLDQVRAALKRHGIGAP
ncbi:MAG TPA: P1 family peptidase [Gemmatimonadales bacterium]|jgi:D-aminopeptidase|nr:P1 family peptidase [Gemmatimonadales bacterium]